MRSLLQRVGDIELRVFGADAADVVTDLYQPDGFTRGAEADGHFRAERAEREDAAQRLGNVAVQLVASVVTHALAEQAGADADQRLVVKRYVVLWQGGSVGIVGHLMRAREV